MGTSTPPVDPFVPIASPKEQPMTEADDTAVAHALLAAAGLRMPEADSDRLAAGYRILRERTDALYAIGTDATAPALAFDPTDA
jgi:hypothetical protein